MYNVRHVFAEFCSTNASILHLCNALWLVDQGVEGRNFVIRWSIRQQCKGRKLNCLGFFVWSCQFVLLCNFSLWCDAKGYDNTVTNMSCANQDTILSGPVSEEPSFITNPRTSENRWTVLQRNVIFQNIIVKDDLGISKVMKISLPNLNDINFRS